MRSVVLRYARAEKLAQALTSPERELEAPEVEAPEDDEVGTGEWVLALVEIDGGRLRTAAAARGAARNGRPVLAFAERDWGRLAGFAQGTEPGSAMPAPFGFESLPDSEPPSRTRGDRRSLGTCGLGARLLLVDDDPDVRDMLGAMLEAVGLVVDTASTAEEALEKARRQPFDMLVLDWSLPGMSGAELCRELRSQAGPARSTPVLFLTAHAHGLAPAFASGADDYVVKPFRAPELGVRIFGLLRRARMANTSI